MGRITFPRHLLPLFKFLNNCEVILDSTDDALGQLLVIQAQHILWSSVCPANGYLDLEGTDAIIFGMVKLKTTKRNCPRVTSGMSCMMTANSCRETNSWTRLDQGGPYLRNVFHAGEDCGNSAERGKLPNLFRKDCSCPERAMFWVKDRLVSNDMNKNKLRRKLKIDMLENRKLNNVQNIHRPKLDWWKTWHAREHNIMR